MVYSRGIYQTSHNPKDFVWYEFAKWFAERERLITRIQDIDDPEVAGEIVASFDAR